MTLGEKKNEFWLVAVDMGYGHQRAAYPLKPWAVDGSIITANTYPEIPEKDLKIWKGSERFYNAISRWGTSNFFGRIAFKIFDYFQRIDSWPPARPGHPPSMQLNMFMRRIRAGWGKDLIERLSSHPAPLVTSYFVVAHMAETWNYPGPIYAIVTDSDISRAWAPQYPERGRVKYFASSLRSKERLESYGVAAGQIFYTGFPLPQSFTEDELRLRKNLARRVARLDPEKFYEDHHANELKTSVGEIPIIREEGNNVPVITFTIGGAGAQVEELGQILESLRAMLTARLIKLNIIVGVSVSAREAAIGHVRRLHLQDYLTQNIHIMYADSKASYFPAFEKIIEETDILWTKPSELSFYGALGLPILMTEPLGAHEVKNREWLEFLGVGIREGNPREAATWLPEYLRSGVFADAAVNGFSKMERGGVRNIIRAISESAHLS